VDPVLNKMEGIQIIGNVKVTVKTFTDAKELDVQEDATIKEVLNIIFLFIILKYFFILPFLGDN
jgi:hypothetical protein